MAKEKEKLEGAIKRCLEILKGYEEDSSHNEMDEILTQVQGILARSVGRKPWVPIRSFKRD